MPIDLYNANTPNGKKIYIFAEEVGINYNHHKISFAKKDQFTPEFLAINPNNKIPAVVDNDPPAEFGSGSVNLFESGAILQYLADHKTPAGAPVLYSKNPRIRTVTNAWVFFQAGGLGPMMGQLGWFKGEAVSAAKSDPASLRQYEKGLERYRAEVLRLFSVLERRFTNDNVPYLAGDEYSIADIMNWPWALAYTRLSHDDFEGVNTDEYPVAKAWKIDIDQYPGVKAWINRVGERPAVKRAIAKAEELNP